MELKRKAVVIRFFSRHVMVYLKIMFLLYGTKRFRHNFILVGIVIAMKLSDKLADHFRIDVAHKKALARLRIETVPICSTTSLPATRILVMCSRSVAWKRIRILSSTVSYRDSRLAKLGKVNDQSPKGTSKTAQPK